MNRSIIHVEQALVINRKPCGVNHPKLKKVIHTDFFDITPILSKLSGYNACFFCLGISSVGLKKLEYHKLTYNLTLYVATHLSQLNPDMTFCYVSGAATDSTEKEKSMWVRVKGKTENDLMKLPFRKVYAFRTGIHATYTGTEEYLKNVFVPELVISCSAQTISR